MEAELEPERDQKRRISDKFTYGKSNKESGESQFPGCTFKFPLTYSETAEHTLCIRTYRNKKRGSSFISDEHTFGTLSAVVR